MESFDKEIILKCWDGEIKIRPPVSFWNFTKDTIFHNSFKCDSYETQASKKDTMKYICPIFFFEHSSHTYTRAIRFKLYEWFGASELWKLTLNSETFIGSIRVLKSNYKTDPYSYFIYFFEKDSANKYYADERAFKFMYKCDPYPYLDIDEISSETSEFYFSQKFCRSYKQITNKSESKKGILTLSVNPEFLPENSGFYVDASTPNKQFKPEYLSKYFDKIKSIMLRKFEEGLDAKSKKLFKEEKFWL